MTAAASHHWIPLNHRHTARTAQAHRCEDLSEKRPHFNLPGFKEGAFPARSIFGPAEDVSRVNQAVARLLRPMC